MARIIIILAVMLTSLLYGQNENRNDLDINYKLGASLETSILLNSKLYSNVDKEELFLNIYPISVYIIGQVVFAKNIAFEIKPGLIFGGEYFTAMEYGVYLRYNFYSQKYFARVGINIHDNIGGAHGVTTYTSVTDESINILGIYFGNQSKTNFAVTLSYFHPFNKYYYYSISVYEGDSYKVNLNQIIKFGFEFIF